MCVNEIWCSICCRFMDEGCKKCNHFDEQVHLDQEDKVDTSPEHIPDADKGTGMITGEDPYECEHAKNSFLLECCMNNPELYNKIGSIIYKLYGRPMGAELTMLVTYVYRELQKEGEK